MKIDLEVVNGIPAFAAYVAGSVKEGPARIIVNMQDLLETVKEDEDPRIALAEVMSETIVHELLHAFQDIFNQAFRELDVEQAIKAAQEIDGVIKTLDIQEVHDTQYSYSIKYDHEVKAFRCVCNEVKDLAVNADTPEAAFLGFRQAFLNNYIGK